MSLACGCSIRPGTPLGTKELKAHYKHTLESMYFWQLMRREGTTQDDRLSQAVADFIDALDTLYPEAQE